MMDLLMNFLTLAIGMVIGMAVLEWNNRHDDQNSFVTEYLIKTKHGVKVMRYPVADWPHWADDVIADKKIQEVSSIYVKV